MKNIQRLWLGLLAMMVCGWVQLHVAVAGGGGLVGWSKSLPNGSPWGIHPDCTPTLVGSNLFASSNEGGSYNQGAIFFITADGAFSFPVYEFGAVPGDGDGPCGQLLMMNSQLYGMTSYGGAYSAGTIFCLNTNTWAESILHNFSDSPTNGSSPYGALVSDGSTLYGMTSQGGLSNCGTVFAYYTGPVLIGASRFAILHHFTGGTNDGDAANSYGGLVLSGSRLYGLCANGGSNGLGVLFGLNIDGSGFTLHHHFRGVPPESCRPFGSLTRSGAWLYGMSVFGGEASGGTVFSYWTGPALPGANRLHLLHSFTGGDGDPRGGGLSVAGTNLYGMVAEGGPSNGGTIFQLHTDGTGFTNLLMFTGSGSGVASGATPYQPLNLIGKSIYGATYAGGLYSNGTVFRVDLPQSPKLWLQTDAGQLAAWKLTSAGGVAGANLMENTGAWMLKAAGDIDGDGVADLLFQDGSHNMAGWLMNLDMTKRSASYWSNTGVWDLKACADFEGTGRAQVLFQKPDGSLALWRLNPDGSYNSSLGLTTSGSAYVLRGAGDLDGDGKADLIFQNAAGNLAVWKHKADGTLTGGVLPGAGTWVLRAVLDVDSDSIADLAWQAPDGNLAGWFMNTNLSTRAVFPVGAAGVYRLRAGGR